MRDWRNHGCTLDAMREMKELVLVHTSCREHEGSGSGLSHPKSAIAVTITCFHDVQA